MTTQNTSLTIEFPDTPVRPGPEDMKPGGPAAWMNPSLLSFEGKRTSCPPELIPQLEGTAVWHPEVYRDCAVKDKAGTEHQPRALVYHDDFKALADAVRFLARRCDEQGFYAPVRQRVVQDALAKIALMEAHMPETVILAGEREGAPC